MEEARSTLATQEVIYKNNYRDLMNLIGVQEERSNNDIFNYNDELYWCLRLPPMSGEKGELDIETLD